MTETVRVVDPRVPSAAVKRQRFAARVAIAAPDDALMHVPVDADWQHHEQIVSIGHVCAIDYVLKLIIHR